MTSDRNLVPIPNELPYPPRGTGNAQNDYPVMIDWFWQAFQVIRQSINYINSQVNNAEFSVADLPDPTTATTATAQQTANEAYQLASTAINRLNNLVSGIFTVQDPDVGTQVIFDNELPDNNYRIIVQPVSFTGAPPIEAFIVNTKTYQTTDFTVIMGDTPGAGNSITFEWQLIRNI